MADTAASGSEDVADFLRRIKELGDKRDQEDAERTRKLEEEILEGRRLREARRAERARSLSPEKRGALSNSQPRTPQRVVMDRADRETRSSKSSSSTLSSSSNTLGASMGEGMTEPKLQKPIRNHPIASPTKSPPIRTNKPESLMQTGNPLRQQPQPTLPLGRPSSLVERTLSPLNTQPSIAAVSSSSEQMSRDQISARLAAKDPAWFSQTETRTAGAVGLRRNRQEDEDADRVGLENRPLPGMDKENEDERHRSEFTSTERGRPALSMHNVSRPSATPSLPRPHSMTLERPVSPIKGTGGFVQSAMKRSDSVNKRWSVQTPTGLSRSGSSASLREAGNVSMLQRPENVGPADTMSRQPASESKATERKTGTQHTPSRLAISTQADSDFDTSQHHKRSQSIPRAEEAEEKKPDDLEDSTSPSKRWSPVKSSWLESALSRPSSPQLLNSSPSQPAWLSELNKAKQQKPNTNIQPKEDESRISQPYFTSPTVPAARNAPAKPKPMSLREKPREFNLSDSGETPPSFPVRHSATASQSSVKAPPPAIKPKPDVVPKTDFKANLKGTSGLNEPPKEEELEFRSAFGRLRRASPEKYAPPDELKDNILRGKAGLSHTDGPQPSSRKDELKESLIKQRHNLATSTATAASPKQALESSTSSGNILPLLSKTQSEGAKSPEQKQFFPLRSATTFPAKPAASDSVDNSSSLGSFQNNLASIMAKGPPIGNKSDASTFGVSYSLDSAADGSAHESSSSSAPLQHMTKGRARGPKRRLPNENTSVSAAVAGAQSPEKNKPVTAMKSSSFRNVTSPRSSTHLAMPTNSARTLDQLEVSPSPEISSVDETSPPRIERPILPPRLRSSHSGGLQRTPSLPSRPSKPAELRSASGTMFDAINRSTPRHNMQPDVVEEQSVPGVRSVKDVTSQWGKRAALNSSDNYNVPTSKSFPHTDDLKQFSRDHGVHRAGTVSGSPSRRVSRPGVPTEAKSPPLPARGQPPKIARKPSAAAIQATRKASQTLGLAPETHSDDQTSKQLFAAFFDNTTHAGRLEVDTQSIVNTRLDESSKIRTLRREISELSAAGKTTPLPPQQDHILFSRSTYICTHIFGDSTGARNTEVYLWAGSSVADGIIEEALVVGRKVAKDCGGKLVMQRQGKECLNFFKALGGIIITRNGTLRDHKKSYMLCGRRHLGQIAFDEVDLSPMNLCSGFPFIIAAAATNTIFLWKGKGCHAEELAGARLMSMDLGLSGQVVEVDEGQEMAGFLSAFPSTITKDMLQWSDHWKLKPKTNDYHVRLFRVEKTSIQNYTMTAIWNRVRQPVAPESVSNATTQVSEVTPFCEADIEPENIYVLDAFFEIYILVGPLARAKFPAFADALLFAQDYAIVAASVQDRPFVPQGTVLMLEGAMPREVRPVFRQYGCEENMSTGTLMAGKVRRQGDENVKVMPLSAAIAAIRGT